MDISENTAAPAFPICLDKTVRGAAWPTQPIHKLGLHNFRCHINLD